MRRHIDPTVYSYNESAPHPKRRYDRHDRFTRILRGLNGVETVKTEIIDRVLEHKFNHEDPLALRAVLAGDKQLRRSVGKIASIFYQLGNQFTPLSPEEILRAKRLFSHLPRCSFIITLPYILKRIARQDLLVFCKPLSQNMKKKYDALCVELGSPF